MFHSTGFTYLRSISWVIPNNISRLIRTIFHYRDKYKGLSRRKFRPKTLNKDRDKDGKHSSSTGWASEFNDFLSSLPRASFFPEGVRSRRVEHFSSRNSKKESAHQNYQSDAEKSKFGHSFLGTKNNKIGKLPLKRGEPVNELQIGALHCHDETGTMLLSRGRTLGTEDRKSVSEARTGYSRMMGTAMRIMCQEFGRWPVFTWLLLRAGECRSKVEIAIRRRKVGAFMGGIAFEITECVLCWKRMKQFDGIAVVLLELPKLPVCLQSISHQYTSKTDGRLTRVPPTSPTRFLPLTPPPCTQADRYIPIYLCTTRKHKNDESAEWGETILQKVQRKEHFCYIKRDLYLRMETRYAVNRCDPESGLFGNLRRSPDGTEIRRHYLIRPSLLSRNTSKTRECASTTTTPNITTRTTTTATMVAHHHQQYYQQYQHDHQQHHHYQHDLHHHHDQHKLNDHHQQQQQRQQQLKQHQHHHHQHHYHLHHLHHHPQPIHHLHHHPQPTHHLHHHPQPTHHHHQHHHLSR
ncbi:unnamed protein product [Nesidiocoris tenuis]|uniref:Uncharacterized protein n=1 Tax=Nesidiocoris tenuis TaxID=355587 RepID=A0A6H5HDN5_9HEMI|nr:unnamed protein product [Nesidiocoris tenuis]